MATKEVKVRRPTKENFGQLGQFIQKPDVSRVQPTLENDFLQFFGGLAGMKPAPMEFGICSIRRRSNVFNQLEQHQQTQELLYAIAGDFYLPVLPFHDDGSPDMANPIAIHVKQGEGVILNQGVWHWAPYATGESASFLVGFKEGTAVEDLIILDMDEEIRIVEA